ncbi:MAG: 4,5-DOPA dioxygenase extradiol [Candidatus Celerinatantimonas neptuna]|nr:MAG: 4,5-DOPA dioxygenase extradiol [Candidatus Celerinatantimonas neptuna]
MSRLPTFFLSHGGGPWPWMSEYGDVYAQMAESFAQIPQSLPETPKAILVVTAHWEASHFTVSSAEHPGMLYDYYGFPEHTYRVHYSAPGDPQLANRVAEQLDKAGIEAGLDSKRGYDHGTFTPLAVIYPDADIPVVQLSIRSDFDLKTHFAVGEVLRPFRDEGILIIGSGLTYHNLRRFSASAQKPSQEFDQWLKQTLELPEQQRHRQLDQWELAPSARIAQPREDHLMPLWVALGAASDGSVDTFYRQHDFFGGITVSSYRFD